jgi:hypothetical protein
MIITEFQRGAHSFPQCAAEDDVRWRILDVFVVDSSQSVANTSPATPQAPKLDPSPLLPVEDGNGVGGSSVLGSLSLSLPLTISTRPCGGFDWLRHAEGRGNMQLWLYGQRGSNGPVRSTAATTNVVVYGMRRRTGCPGPRAGERRSETLTMGPARRWLKLIARAGWGGWAYRVRWSGSGIEFWPIQVFLFLF